MSSACSVPATNPARAITSQSSHHLSAGSISYEGRLSLLAPETPATSSDMEFDQAVVLRRIKAECDSMLDFQSIHKDNFMGVDVSTLPLYSSGFSPNHPGNGPANLFQQQAAERIKTPEYPSTPIRPQQADSSANGGRQPQDDSGISPGSTGPANSATGSTNSGDESKKRNGHSECEDVAAGSDRASGSPFSDHYSGDERRMLLTPMDEDDDELLDDDDDDLLDEEGSSRGAGSDVVGDALSRLERALMTQPTDANSATSATVYQCTMCSYSAASRFHFQAHLNSHFDVKCTHCDFTARTEGKLRAHIRNAHSDALGLDDGEVGGSRVPRVNAQGKLKTHKCKHPQCGFVAVTKLDFWEHSRTHIKAEKLLTCPHCPFVTEYKHHLEYHTRNHLNSKPFKCPKCSYSCVNKSMLNSHMKSHSNVYQFRCKDCAYATKYQHSLKLHLRKYGHTSTSNLSLSDPANGGDVTGSPKTKGRRGPKKPRTKSGQKRVDASPPNNHPASLPNAGQMGSPPSLPHPFNFPLYGGHPLLVGNSNGQQMEPEKKKMRLPSEDVLKCTLCDYATASKDHFSQHLLAHAAADQHHRDLANLFGVLPPESLLLNSPSNPPPPPPLQQTPLKGSPVMGLNSSTPQQNQMKDYINRMLANPTLLFGTPTPPMVQQHIQNERKKLAQHSRTPTPEIATPPPAVNKPNQTPLDLSREKDDAPPQSSKHRRKGQAFKLERSAATPPRHTHSATPSPSAAHSVEDEEHIEESEEEVVAEPVVVRKEVNAKRRNGLTDCPGERAEWGGAYQCAYCDIAFKDVVMYTMHMGYHGYQDPFTCNMCGQSTHDKLAFFLHIARSSHS